MRHRNFFDIFFSLSLLSVFVLCSACLLMFQIHNYDAQRQKNEVMEESRLLESYLTTIFHQQNASQAINQVQIDTTNCLMLRDLDQKTVKYIYAYDGYLRELYLDEQAMVDLSQGDEIAPLDQLEISKEANLYTFTFVKKDKQTQISLATKGWEDKQ